MDNRKQRTACTIGSGGQDAETKHATKEPVACIRSPILNNSSHGQAICEPFLGSGTKVIAVQSCDLVCLVSRSIRSSSTVRFEGRRRSWERRPSVAARGHYSRHFRRQPRRSRRCCSEWLHRKDGGNVSNWNRYGIAAVDWPVGSSRGIGGLIPQPSGALLPHPPSSRDFFSDTRTFKFLPRQIPLTKQCRSRRRRPPAPIFDHLFSWRLEQQHFEDFPEMPEADRVRALVVPVEHVEGGGWMT